jgi:hypothetical protein
MRCGCGVPEFDRVSLLWQLVAFISTFKRAAGPKETRRIGSVLSGRSTDRRPVHARGPGVETLRTSLRSPAFGFFIGGLARNRNLDPLSAIHRTGDALGKVAHGSGRNRGRCISAEHLRVEPDALDWEMCECSWPERPKKARMTSSGRCSGGVARTVRPDHRETANERPEAIEGRTARDRRAGQFFGYADRFALNVVSVTTGCVVRPPFAWTEDRLFFAADHQGPARITCRMPLWDGTKVERSESPRLTIKTVSGREIETKYILA